MTFFQNTKPDVALTGHSITERVFAGLVDRPDDIVLTDGATGQTLTGQAFMEAVKSLAGGLAARDFGKGSTVALIAANSPEFCVVFHAVAWAGGTVTTINPTYTAAEIKHQLNDSGANMVVTDPMFLDAVRQGMEGTSAKALAVIGTANGVQSIGAYFGDPIAQQVPVDIERHSVALPYSSGTTGLPKGVRLSHRNLVVNVDQILVGADFRVGEVAACFLPLFHIYGMTVMMNLHLAGGGALVTMPRFDLEQFLQISQDHKARRMWIVPPVALALAKHPLVANYDLSALDQIFCGAAPMGEELSDAVAARLDCEMLQGFGMTEMAPVSHITPLAAPRSGASGLALPNTACRIVDPETGVDLPAGERGELWVKGPQVMLGYLNNAQATADTLTQDGWLKTGDIAIIDADGYMFIVDRLKELIKYKGFQVAPAELEAVLVSHERITDAAVIGRPDADSGEVPVAYVVATDPAPSEVEIKSFLSKRLAHYKQVEQVSFVDAIPKSASGKILRRVLRDQVGA